MIKYPTEQEMTEIKNKFKSLTNLQPIIDISSLECSKNNTFLKRIYFVLSLNSEFYKDLAKKFTVDSEILNSDLNYNFYNKKFDVIEIFTKEKVYKFTIEPFKLVDVYFVSEFDDYTIYDRFSHDSFKKTSTSILFRNPEEIDISKKVNILNNKIGLSHDMRDKLLNKYKHCLGIQKKSKVYGVYFNSFDSINELRRTATI
jgi:hypothetical protein